MFKRLVTFFLVLVPALMVAAQEEQYNFSRIDIENGLSHNQINAVLKDDLGFMWFGTMSGLNRYDGYKFRTFKHHQGDTTSINDDYIIRIVQGPDKNLWILTRRGWNVYDPLTEKFNVRPARFLNGVNIPDDTFTDIVIDRKNNFWFVFPARGLYRYNAAGRKTEAFYSDGSASTLHSNAISTIGVNSKGNIWIVYNDGIIDEMEGNTGRILGRTNILQKNLHGESYEFKLFIDKQDELWMYGFKSAKGVFNYKPANNTLVVLDKDSKNGRLNSNLITGITQDEKGVIWVATDHGGVNLVRKTDFSVRYLLNAESDNKSISQNSINSIYRDNAGTIWVGTFKKGISYFHDNSVKFPLFRHSASNRNSIPYEDINAFAEDAAGNIWIGTNGGGLLFFNRAAGTFRQYLHDPTNNNSLSNNVIVTLCIDHQQKLWIGSYFGGLDCFDGNRFIHRKHSDSDPGSLSDDRVWKVFEDSRQRLWVGTLDQGLELFDRQQNKFIHYKQGAPNSIHSRYVSSIIEDNNRNIWFATAFGLDMLDARTGFFTHFEHSETDKSSLSQNNLIDLLQDTRGLIWIASRDGLNVYDPVKKQFSVFTTSDGLPDNTILTLLEDNAHNIWVSTPQGLSRVAVSFTAATRQLLIKCKNYDEADGLQGREFNEKSSLKTKRGELVFGGANGFNIFQPSEIHDNKKSGNLLVTDLKLFNNSVQIGQHYDEHVVLNQSITRTREVNLRYNENVFSLEFASLNFLDGERVKYAYKLEGFNKDWLITDGKDNIATFTNLDPGDYTFYVKTVETDGSDSSGVYSLRIHILPPFWKMPIAYVIYFVLIGVILLFARDLVLRRAKVRFALEQERREAKQVQELNLLKIKFLTNISHEFRTPLSLIITPVEKLINQDTAGGQEKKQFQLIYRNAKRLLNLVNELLDFKKLEEQELHVNTKPGNIIQFIKSLSFSFSEIAQTKKISLLFHSSEEIFYTSFDHNKIERIVFNLLSNAFKFTPEGGSVQVAIDVLSPEDENGRQMLQLKVIDTGIGIEKEKQELIFERFYQAATPDTMVNQGSGIGLSMCREFVKLQNGTISVESEPGKGACFIVLLPFVALVGYEDAEGTLVEEEDEEPETAATPLPVKELEKSNEQKRTVLIVEDNDDFRYYLKDNLQKNYVVIEAINGKMGWQKTLSAHPDLVICDISMPEMNGLDLCKKIKSDKRTAHLPVIILTALSDKQYELSGLETGASDYITKPFNQEILQSKIRNLLQQQESFKKTYQKQVQANPTELVLESADDKFIQNALTILEKNISNPDFSVEEMSRELFLSRVALYKKLFALTGKTPLEFIRSIRLKRAKQLLEKNEMTVAEVAYEVGFNNPKVFSRYFKQEYNVLPSSYQGEKTKTVVETDKENPA